MNRLIKLLTSTASPESDTLYAVCEDDTVWCIGPWRDSKWQQLPSIPGEEELHGDPWVRN
jgi:hypothetical protein